LDLAMYFIKSDPILAFAWIWFATSSAVAPLAVRVRNLLDCSVLYCVVLIQVLSMAPYVSSQQINALHFQEYFDGVGHCLHIRWGYLDRSEPGASLHQVEEVNIRCSEGHVDHLFIRIEIGNLSSFLNSGAINNYTKL
jgi:hypothetical protein